MKTSARVCTSGAGSDPSTWSRGTSPRRTPVLTAAPAAAMPASETSAVTETGTVVVYHPTARRASSSRRVPTGTSTSRRSGPPRARTDAAIIASVAE